MDSDSDSDSDSSAPAGASRPQEQPEEDSSSETSEHPVAAAAAAAAPIAPAAKTPSALATAPRAAIRKPLGPPSEVPSQGAFSVDTDTLDGKIGRPEEDLARSSVSVNSSVYKFVEKFGRTYHKYKAGKYLLPNDEQERNRLDLQHHISLSILDGRLQLAPIGDVKRVLDIGTGTGLWVLEFAEEHPKAEILGTDLSPIQPEYVPANVRFEVDDIEDDWTYTAQFDYIHGRCILPSLRNHPAVIRRVYDNLRPGGHAEFMETVMILESVDDSLQDTVLLRWRELLREGVARLGLTPMDVLKTRQWLLDAGFVNVVEKKFAVPINSWPRGAENKIRGQLMMTNLLELAGSITMDICTKVWGWSPTQVNELLVDIRKDIQNRAHHGYVPIICVYGQKPEEETSPQTAAANAPEEAEC